jgi:nucleotide-binding universal stress UspA family protein
MYNKILVPLDGSRLAECVLPHVDSIVKGCTAGEVIFLRVREPLQAWNGGDEMPFKSDADFQQWNADKRAEAENYLKIIADRTKYEGVQIRTEVVSGRPAQTITEYATRNGVDLIIIANHGSSGPSQMFTGNVADRLIHNPRMPILLVNTPDVFMGV